MATAGFVSERLVTVEIADRGEAKDLKCVVRVRDAACRPGADRISDRFFSTIGAPAALGSKPLVLGFGTARLRCHPIQRFEQHGS